MVDRVNIEAANRLEEVARLLEDQRANRFRVEAYDNAARMLRRLERSVAAIDREEGLDGLKALPGVGETIARAIHQLVIGGRLPMLERLRGESDPVTLLAQAPGIGRVLAERLHEDLGIDTLEELEAAAYDGRLAGIAGFGPKRLAGLRDALATRLGRIRERRAESGADEPPVSEILDVDREYRESAARGRLPTIAPRRFNPDHKAWLPVLHTNRANRHYSALFSNTARAHQMGRTADWVVLYYDGTRGERQCTVITSQRGPLEGKRIVRGREAQCAEYYLHSSPAPLEGGGLAAGAARAVETSLT